MSDYPHCLYVFISDFSCYTQVTSLLQHQPQQQHQLDSDTIASTVDVRVLLQVDAQLNIAASRPMEGISENNDDCSLTAHDAAINLVTSYPVHTVYCIYISLVRRIH